MSSAGAELSSLATALEELLRRVTALAESSADDTVGHELYEVERGLTAAHRRLARLASDLT